VTAEAVADFLAGGAEAGEGLALIATEEHADAILTCLKLRGVDLSKVTVHDAHETLAKIMVDSTPDRSRFEPLIIEALDLSARRARGQRVRAYGEMVDVLRKAGNHQAAIRLEQMWNELSARHSISFYPSAESAESTENAERKLRRAETSLRDFIHNAAIGLHGVDRNGIILWANAAELAMLGYQEHEYVGRNIAEFHADREVVENILARLGNKEIVRDQEARLIAKDGSIKYVTRYSKTASWSRRDVSPATSPTKRRASSSSRKTNGVWRRSPTRSRCWSA
jgi:PAS domain S-box-containing protein